MYPFTQLQQLPTDGQYGFTYKHTPHSQVILFYFIFKIYLFIFGCVGFSLLRAGATLLWCAGFSFWWLLWLRSTGSRHVDSVVVAPRHVGSSRARDRTRVPCIGRRILNHCATREVLQVILIQILVT